MKKFQLKAQKRQITGKKVKNLRRQQILPGNIFGKKIKSESIQIPILEFAKIYQVAHETSIVELDIDGQKQPALIQNVQTHPVTGDFIHVDFFQVDMKEKVKTKIPVDFVGSAPAVEQKLGLILKLTDEVEIEALPADLPEKLTLDLTVLRAVGDVLKAGDIKLPEGVALLTKPESEIAKIGELLTKEAEKQKAEEEAAKAAAAAQTAAVAQPPAENGQAKTETPAPAVKEVKEVTKNTKI